MSNQKNYHPEAPITILIHETLKTETISYGQNGSLNKIVNGSRTGPVEARVIFNLDDFLMITPKRPLDNNSTYEVSIADGGIQDAVGNGIKGYSFRFSTGDSIDGGIDLQK